MPQSVVSSMQGKNTGNMPSAMCASSMNKSLEDNLKNKNNLKNKDNLKKIICPPHLRDYYLNIFLMTSHLNSCRTTNIKPEMLSVVQKMELHIINIIYAALTLRERTEKTTFSCQED